MATRIRNAAGFTAMVAVILSALTLGCAGAIAQTLRVHGDVVGIEGGVLMVRMPGGETTKMRIPDNVRVSQRAPAQWSDIRPGSYVGTTAVPQPDGTLRAREVHIFSEAQRGSGEGHRPMATPGDTMTNATVVKIGGAPPRPHDTMTNATVARQSEAAGGHRMTLTYKGGEQTVVVPPDCPIITSQPGDRSLLAAGAHVVAYARRSVDGGLSAERISVGKDGYSPPI